MLAAPGRYLWVQLVLRGTERVSPRVRALRVERPGHDLLNALPRSWSRDDDDADFLQRLLAPAEGMLHELDEWAERRAVLVDPRATPSAALDWLAGFAALALDQRWPETARRTLIAEVYQLYRRRGTKAALLRILAIYLGYPPQLVEAWQLRGLAGAVLGTRPGALAATGGRRRVGTDRQPRPVRGRRRAARPDRLHRLGAPVHAAAARRADRRAAQRRARNPGRRTSRRTPWSRSASSAPACGSVSGCGWT